MKKITLLLLVVLASCSKQESTTETVSDSNLNYYDKAYIETASLDEQLEYKRFHLKKIANWLLKNDFEVYETLSKELSNTKRIVFSLVISMQILLQKVLKIYGMKMI
jgi:hypothetical protein